MTPKDVHSTPAHQSAAFAIEHVLDQARLSYISRDYERYRQLYSLPLSIGSFLGDRIVKDEVALRQFFDDFCAMIDRMGIVEMQFKTIAAQFVDPMTIKATYVVKFVDRNMQLSSDTIAHGIFKKSGDTWQMNEAGIATDIPDLTRVILKAGEPAQSAFEA